MTSALPFVLLPVALILPLPLARVSDRVDLALTRVALALFGDYVAQEGRRKRVQRERLHAAHVGTVHRVFAARGLLSAAIMGLAGSLLGVYVTALVLQVLQIGPETLREILPGPLGFLAQLTQLTSAGPFELFALLAFSSATVGASLALLTYYGRWALLDQKARARGSGIEATLPRTVAFVYALSRSGMSFPTVLGTLTENEEVYGEAARELGVAVRDMNTFGTDVLTALEAMATRTPSENMAEFSDNLASVMGSGKSLSEFLREQYDRYQDEAEAQQAQYLELLAAFAEAYVTVLVAGVLFLLTILAVIGLVLQNTLPLLRFMTYIGIPLATAGFALYLDSITGDVTGGQPSDREVQDSRVWARSTDREQPERMADGGFQAATSDRWAASRERLKTHDRLKRLRRVIDEPFEVILDRPTVTTLLTIPVGLVWIGLRAGAVPLNPTAAARTLDSPLIEATLLVLATAGILYEIDKRRTRAIEAAVPDFLDRLASVNEAGMTVVESLQRLTRSNVGALTPEIRRAWRDVQWGADVSTALRRMDDRTDSAMVSRAVTLVSNAMEASGDIAPVLSIAAEEARATRRLRRERRQTMLTYLLVIYLSFAVFLGIVAALTASFIPAVENAQIAAGTAAATTPGIFGGLGGIDPDAYQLVFYHAAAIQAVCSGVVAGQLGEGQPVDGLKHATVLLLAAYVAFAFIGA